MLIVTALDMIFYLISVRQIQNLILYPSHLSVSFDHSPTARMSFQNTVDLACNFILFFRYLLLNIITSKLYTFSLLGSLNSRRGWGYDTSENNDGEFDLSTELGLRFAGSSQAMVEQTSVIITTPPVSPLCFFSPS